MKKHGYTYINTEEAWQAAAADLMVQPMIAVDIESNGLHTYPEHICLLQFATAERVLIVDPKTVGSGKELRTIFADAGVEKIFHSCDYDIRSLDRDYKVRIVNLFDTAIAAQFLGAGRLGLGNVMQEFLGVQLEKSKKLQQMDWGMRPLPENALRYAADDVAYLIRLRNELMSKLTVLHRAAWVQEEAERMQDLRHRTPNPPEEAFKTVKGSRTLKPHQMAVLREVYLFRDQIALQCGRPPFKIMNTSTMLELAMKPKRKLTEVPGLSRWLLSRAESELRAALARGRNADPVHLVSTRFRSPWNRASLARLGTLKNWRTRQGELMVLDPSLLWPAVSLERMALNPDERDIELFKPGNGEVRNWQRKMFAEQIAALPLWQTHKG